MDNHNSSHSYPYHNPYGYPPPSSSPYPPSNPAQNPPPNYAPYPPPSYTPYPPPGSAQYPSYAPPYAAPHPSHLPYPYQSPPPSQPPRPSHSGHLEYGYPPPPQSHSGHVPYPYYPIPPATQSSPQHTLQQHHSFHGSTQYNYDPSPALPPAENHPNDPSRYENFSGHHQHGSLSSFSLPPNENVNDNLNNTATYPHSYPHVDGPSRHDSFSSHHHHHHGSSSFSLPPNENVNDKLNNTATYPHSYPNIDGPLNNNAPNYPLVHSPIEDHLANVHLSENYPSTTASPPVPSALALSAPRPYHQSFSGRYDSEGSLYGHSSYAGSHSGPIDPSPRPGLSHSSSFANSQHSQGFQLVPFGSPQKALQVLLLHGNLDIWVHEAKNLPNMDMFHKTVGEMFNRLPGNATKVTSDPYVSITIASAVVGRTYVISNNENPVWMQHFNVPVAHRASEVHFLVKDSDVVGSQLIGTVAIPTESISSGARLEGSFPLINANGRPCKNGATLSISIQYTPMERLSIYNEGVGAGPQYYGIPATYFPLRRGGKVTLYQDAHVPDGYLPDFRLDGDMQYVHGKCWRDIFDAICRAQRLIYLTGWSVWHKVKLVRDTGAPSECCLGELLKSKSQEGVRVLLLVWDDPTSRSIMGYKTDGLMATHDEETRRFFKHSSVQVLLCPRMAGKRLSWYKKKQVGIYTHHQKTVIVDAEAGNNKRRIVAFLGGLDLCNGRYDTPQHHIFRTLKTVHAEDYHNPTFAGNLAGCPREPWHDLHCRIDGPAAYDVLTNFEERWLKASKPHGIKKLKNSYDDALLRIERMPEMFHGLSDDPCQNDQDPEGWHVQIFRSIDSNSVKGLPKDPKEATSKNLVCGKNVLIDMSIHSAYVKAIRSAQHFIYIENQYFIGSSYNWNSYKELGADNLIPMEIALKIAQKIRAHERFAVYIVIPMWPEGNPTESMLQRILFWQHKTMQMMYETIARALMEVGLEDAHSPQDFLNFFCLGNREPIGPGDSSNNESPSASNTPQAQSRKNRRFMIYVHSKGMIVDDEYIIIGSANINQRSMEGTRDTEIAMGAYQPHHTWARKLSNPRAQIYGYRMSLWAEHIGVVEEEFMEPQTLECVRRVKSLAEANWKQFASDEITEMKGHLLKYPVEVARNGKVKPIPGCEKFPDIGGNIVGSFIGPQENLTI